MSDIFAEKKRALEKAEREYTEAINVQRQLLLKERADIDKQLAELDTISGTKTTRTRRSGVRKEVLAIIKKNPQGIARAGILTALNADDKAAQQSISNALSSLKKANNITLVDGNYKTS